MVAGACATRIGDVGAVQPIAPLAATGGGYVAMLGGTYVVVLVSPALGKRMRCAQTGDAMAIRASARHRRLSRQKLDTIP
jgi:hypothetical protein